MPLIAWIALAVVAALINALAAKLLIYRPQHAAPRRYPPDSEPQNDPWPRSSWTYPADAYDDWYPPTPAPGPMAAALSGPRITAGRMAPVALPADATVTAIRTGIAEAVSREYAVLYSWAAHFERVLA